MISAWNSCRSDPGLFDALRLAGGQRLRDRCLARRRPALAHPGVKVVHTIEKPAGRVNGWMSGWCASRPYRRAEHPRRSLARWPG